MCKNLFVDRKGGGQLPISSAFLLAQLGAYASAKFGERIAPLGLSRPHAGILRLLAGEAGLSQQRLASILKLHPSRLVAILDELESMGLVERRENPEDRRTHALHLTEKGRAIIADLGRIAREHNDTILAALKPKEREELGRLLRLVADDQGLTPGVHPGYRQLGEKPPRSGNRQA